MDGDFNFCAWCRGVWNVRNSFSGIYALDHAFDRRGMCSDHVLFAGVDFRAAACNRCSCGGDYHHLLRVFRGCAGKPAIWLECMGLFGDFGEYFGADLSPVYGDLVLPVLCIFRGGKADYAFEHVSKKERKEKKKWSLI